MLQWESFYSYSWRSIFYTGEWKIPDEFLSSLFLFLSSSFSPHVLQFPSGFRNLSQVQSNINNGFSQGFQILTSLVTRSSIFWDITPCSEPTCFIWYLLALLFDPEDGVDLFFRNFYCLSSGYTALYPRWENPSSFLNIVFYIFQLIKCLKIKEKGETIRVTGHEGP
jgi:hypothetical protein